MVGVNPDKNKLSYLLLPFPRPSEEWFFVGGPMRQGEYIASECHFGRRVVGPLVRTCCVVLQARSQRRDRIRFATEGNVVRCSEDSLIAHREPKLAGEVSEVKRG